MFHTLGASARFSKISDWTHSRIPTDFVACMNANDMSS